MEMALLPLVFKELLSRLPEEIRTAERIRVSAEKDTVVAARLVQRWREPRNTISILKPEAPGNYQFLIASTYADKVTHRVADLLKGNKPFAFLVPTSLLGEIPRKADGSMDSTVAQAMTRTTKIVLTSMGHTWVINYQEFKSFVTYGEELSPVNHW